MHPSPNRAEIARAKARASASMREYPASARYGETAHMTAPTCASASALTFARPTHLWLIFVDGQHRVLNDALSRARGHDGEFAHVNQPDLARCNLARGVLKRGEYVPQLLVAHDETVPDGCHAHAEGILDVFGQPQHRRVDPLVRFVDVDNARTKRLRGADDVAQAPQRGSRTLAAALCDLSRIARFARVVAARVGRVAVVVVVFLVVFFLDGTARAKGGAAHERLDGSHGVHHMREGLAHPLPEVNGHETHPNGQNYHDGTRETH